MTKEGSGTGNYRHLLYILQQVGVSEWCQDHPRLAHFHTQSLHPAYNHIHWLQVLFLDFWAAKPKMLRLAGLASMFVGVVSDFLMDTPEQFWKLELDAAGLAADIPVGAGDVLTWMLELGSFGGVGHGGLLMVSAPVLLFKLELGPGLKADDHVRLLVVSAGSRAIFWSVGVVGAGWHQTCIQL